MNENTQKLTKDQQRVELERMEKVVVGPVPPGGYSQWLEFSTDRPQMKPEKSATVSRRALKLIRKLRKKQRSCTVGGPRMTEAQHRTVVSRLGKRAKA